MSIPLTELKKLEFDLDRELKGYAGGSLIFYNYKSGDTLGSVVLEIVDGWKFEATGVTGVRVSFTERASVDIRAAIFGARPNRFKVGGQLHTIDDEGITQPHKEPFVWIITGKEIRGARRV